uniref:EF-hand domain-containing protein n=1 Tax=Parascaris univalens TaxID=6257 RepID=A0A915C6M2_PARUN
MASRKTLNRRPRPQRATSNVFAMFDQAQIQEFKEAFNMIDQNRDGFIDVQDLQDMFASLGKEVKEDFLEKMVNEAPGPINFTMFLTLFGEKLTGTDPEEVIKNAFQCFDEDNSGYLNEDRLRELLTTMGDRYTDEQVCHSSMIGESSHLVERFLSMWRIAFLLHLADMRFSLTGFFPLKVLLLFDAYENQSAARRWSRTGFTDSYGAIM